MDLTQYLYASSNALTSEYVTLAWNKTKWIIEESDEPIGGLIEMFNRPKLPTYQMPTQFANLEWAIDSYERQVRLLDIGPETVLSYRPIRGGKGPEVRASIVQAYEDIVEAGLRELKQDGYDERARLLARVWPKVRKKLVWKRIA